MATPGVPDAIVNSLVHSHGIKPIEGTTDAIFLPRQMAYQEAASSYAYKYNVLLVKRLVASPDAATSRLMSDSQAELARLERADPIADALSSFRSGNPKLIGIAGEKSLGTPDSWDVDPIIYNTPYIWLKSNESLLNPKDNARLRQLIKSYVVPYNKKMSSLLMEKNSQKHQNIPVAHNKKIAVVCVSK